MGVTVRQLGTMTPKLKKLRIITNSRLDFNQPVFNSEIDKKIRTE
ncbi:hypothetical protein M595_4562 [Lyngbya aestuarii BL J]|uniref:Uncharacterized protein n=1 Tax=Lyngbya aestuarii BL J TaxID=1348334 RepID=U7QE48_9CYAN|nr:hypothetical protein M595_4562 [Lyngbya aestuarii BL J]